MMPMPNLDLHFRCKPMDAEECEQFTDVYWIKFRLVSNARFAKRKLDEYVFLGNRLQVSYAPQFERLDDTKDKLEARRKEVLARLNRKLLFYFEIVSLLMCLSSACNWKCLSMLQIELLVSFDDIFSYTTCCSLQCQLKDQKGIQFITC